MYVGCEEDAQKAGERGCGEKVGHQACVRRVDRWSMGGATAGVANKENPTKRGRPSM